ncbi:Neuroligin-4, X-linked [Halotydeus destructor]|nr:Neuroligin-4, X-linked [Halotydeus destructor]
MAVSLNLIMCLPLLCLCALFTSCVSYRNYGHSDARCSEDIVSQNLEDIVTVTTSYGKVTGRHSYLCDFPGVPERDRPLNVGQQQPYGWRPRSRVRGNVTVFFGVPYAKPPTRENSLRFKPPQPPDHWGAIETIKFRNACPQPLQYTGAARMIDSIHEDCLYLNIYSPYVSSRISELYPVMMYIHDGNFDHGSGNAFPGHMLAASQQVVVVTFNYRLGLLGFFATADNSSAGNYGMLDQVSAIQWVRENIRNFNGNPDNIVLMGPGSGAASAGLLAISPLSRRFVKRVIATSGSAVADWATLKNHILIRNNSIVAGYFYGCRTFHTHKLTDCLKSRSYADVSLTIVKPEVGWLPWAPVLDFATRPRELQFMPDIPEMMLNHGVPFAQDFAYLTGLDRDEGAAMLVEDEDLIRSGFHVTQDYFDKKAAEYIRIYNATLNPDAFKGAIRYMYTPYTDLSNTSLIREGVVNMLSDSWYVAGVDKMVKLLLKNNVKTYMYVLNYTIEGLPWPEWRGVPHDAEYFLTSGAPFMDSKFFPGILNLKEARWSEADRNMSQFFMEAWGNFARYGNPTPQALFNTILWQPMSAKSLQYLSVNTTNYTSIMHRDYKQKESQFWNDYLPSLSMVVPPIWPLPYEPLEEELRIYRAATWAVIAAMILLVFVTTLCSCLYCRAKRDRWGDAAIDDYLPNITTMSTQYSVPSTRANSEMSLASQRSRSRDRVDFVPMKQAYTSSKPDPSSAKYTRTEKTYKTNGSSGLERLRERGDRHTPV